jgi:hypothetical protein
MTCAGRINGRRICFVMGFPSGRVQVGGQIHYIGLVCRAEIRVGERGAVACRIAESTRRLNNAVRGLSNCHRVRLAVGACSADMRRDLTARSLCDRESWNTYFRISLPDRREYGEVDSLHVERKFFCGRQKEKTDEQHPSSDWTSSAFERLNGEK